MGMIATFKMVSTDKIDNLLDQPGSLTNFLFDDVDDSNSYDLDKSWHAIHFMLNGSIQGVSTLAGELIVGGKLLSEEDIGYGPARYFEASKVISISAELEKITSESFMANFDTMLKQGEQIYPGFEDNDEDKQYIRSYFSGIKEFCKKAAHEKKCLISYLS